MLSAATQASMHLGSTHSQAGEALKRPEGGQEAAAPLPACAWARLGALRAVTLIPEFIDLLRDDYRRRGGQPMWRSSPATKSLYDRVGGLESLSIV